jgi:uncharacterized protein YndB with AHSA1/START domain
MEEQEASYELNLSRIFDAEPTAVYRAFVEPGLLAAWFPRVGWSMPDGDAEIDPRPGGRLRYVQVSAAYPALSREESAEFTDADQDRLLAWTKERSETAMAGGAAPIRTVRVEFAAEPHRHTRLDLREEPFAEAAEADARECWNTAFGRLDAVMAEMKVGR